MLKRRILASLALLLILSGALSIGVTPVYAHAIIVRTEPADGAVLATPPRQIRLWFSEPVALGFTSFDMVDGAGHQIAVTAHSDAASLALAVRNQNASAAELLVELPALPPSVYRLSWKTLSNSDLHTTAGSIVFGVQHALDGAQASAAEPVPQLLELALRWLNFAALAGLIGALALAAMTTDNGQRTSDWEIISSRARERMLRLARWSAALAVLAGFGLLLAQASDAGASAGRSVLVSAWSLVGATSYGRYWLLRQALLFVLLITLVFSMKGQSGARTTLFSLRNRLSASGSLILIAITQALQSHATAFNDLSLLRVGADALHVLAASIWAGGLLALTMAIVPLLYAGVEQAAFACVILRRFGALAASSMVALLITGLFMSGQQVASLDALLTTLYGHALLVKIGLASAIALLGLINAASLHQRVAHTLRWLKPRGVGRLTRTVRLEAAGALAVLLLAAFLSAAQPARGPAFDPPAAAALVAAATTRADDLVVTLALRPNRPGQNFITLGVFDTRRPAPAPIDAVVVRLQPSGAQAALSLVAAPLGNGRYEVSDASIASGGELAIAVMIHRPRLPDATTTLAWTVLPAVQSSHPVWVSNRPLAPWATAGALTIVILLGMLLAALGLRRRILPATSLKSTLLGVAGRRFHPLRKE